LRTGRPRRTANDHAATFVRICKGFDQAFGKSK
jgi:hypothetical protein